MYKRDLEPFLKKISSKYPILTLVGPRQSGKSTLARLAFPDYQHVSLEDIDYRELAKNDPRAFLKRFSDQVIIDEIQRAPDLISYLQTHVDQPNTNFKFVLTGSNHLLLMEQISQSLAGRTFIAKLLPFSFNEIKKAPVFGKALDTIMYTGGYPRIYDKKLEASQWLEQYFQTYVEKDVRKILNIKDLELFERFLRLCAARAGNILDLSSLGNDCGITQPTARAWLSVLKASFVCLTLEPHFKNFNKRIIKSPKIYFYDTGLLCFLLKIQNAEELEFHALRGAIFENFIITEKIKSFWNRGQEHSFYFWRDSNGNEVDLVQDKGTHLEPFEIKSAQTFSQNFFKNLNYFQKLQNLPEIHGTCIYAGAENHSYQGFELKSWQDVIQSIIFGPPNIP